MGFVGQFLYSQCLFAPPYPTHDFSGQIVIVTGSNVGLGFEAARHFARLNCAKLILAVRTMFKGEAAKESILSTTKRMDDCIEVWPLDLLSHESVKAFAKRAQSLERIDVLLENAGVGGLPKFSLHDGFEMVLQTNVINTLLLALLLLPKLRDTAEKNKTLPHLSIVTSEMYYMAKFPERNAPDIYAALNNEKIFDAFDRYPTSKLLEVLFVRELVKHTTKPPVIDTVNPGLCQSELTRDIGGMLKAVITLLKALMARTTEVGSRTLVAGTTAGEDCHGQYMSDCTNQPLVKWIETPEGAAVQKKVYEQTMAELEKIVPGIGKNL